MITGNKGEWSEVYTVLRMLADKKIYAADASLNKIEEIYYPLIKILRAETVAEKEVKFEYAYSSDTIVKVMDHNGQVLIEMPIEEFRYYSLLLLDEINDGQGRAFSVKNEIIDFLKDINITRMSETSGTKRDITIIVHDIFTGFKPTLGFSIKSKLGKPATLLNSSQATNFVFKISGDQLTSDELSEVNSLPSIKERIEKIFDSGKNIVFYNMYNSTFCSNLQMIDSNFPNILAELLIIYYSGKSTSSLSDLIELLKMKNPCGYNFNNDHPFYEYKLKAFLIDVALGLKPTEVWQGVYDANGGYIIVKQNGELVCYHIYNRNEFQEYLLRNTKLEQPSRQRHKYGDVYNESGSSFMKMNLQIRFR